MTTPDGGDLEPVVEEQAQDSGPEDLEYDNLDDALAALGDDDPPDEEEPAEASEDEADEADEADDEDEESDVEDAIVELPDGEKLSLSEIADLKANGLRAADYTRKTTEIANERKAVEQTKAQYAERLQFAESTLQKIHQFVEGMIPPEPSLDMARADPGAFMEARAIREQAIAELTKLVTIGENVKSHKGGASEADAKAFREAETKKLVETMPHLRDPVKKHAFDEAVAKTAADFGFSPEEIAATADHRILRLVHYARMGKRSETNRNNAKRRVQTPTKGKAKPSQAPAQTVQSRQAMQRLAKSGSYEDALRVDFD